MKSAPVHALRLDRYSHVVYVSTLCSAEISESLQIAVVYHAISCRIPMTTHSWPNGSFTGFAPVFSGVRIGVIFQTWHHQAILVDPTALVDEVARSSIRKALLQQLEMPSNLIYDALGCRANAQHCRTSTRDLCPSRIVDDVCHQA
jgi:hypothetical protein